MSIYNALLAGGMISCLIGFQTVRAQDEEMSPTLKQKLEDIKDATNDVLNLSSGAKQSVNVERNPYIVSEQAEQWILRAVSTRERERWYRFQPMSAATKVEFDKAFQALAIALDKKIGQLIPDSRFFAFRNASEEAIMVLAIPNGDQMKIHKIGFIHDQWQRRGDSRPFKKGYIWAYNPSDDHKHCTLYSLLLTQNYLYMSDDRVGDGKLAADVVDKNLMGCPIR
ncbi:MAG: hypothetical protein JSS79_08615 [Bacteroidetes bacterium]|nr:hypothetical protein [Bacteroidota bacterium]